MPTLSKEVLTQKIKDLGETPPSQWSRAQLEARWTELKEEKGVTTQEFQKSLMTRLHQASKKKINLQHFIQNELQLEISGNETIPVLLTMGNKAILMNLVATGTDVLGFGKYAQDSYATVLQNDKAYVEWCIKTASEESVNWRMERFLAWVSQEEVPNLIFPKEVKNKLLKYPHRRQGPSSGYTSSSGTEGSFSLIPNSPLQDTWNPEDDESAETQVQKLEEQIREIRRAQALNRKDPSMKVDSESPAEKTLRK